MLKDLRKLVGKKTNEKIAIEKYKRQLRENPEEQPIVHIKLGKLYEKIGNKKSAIQEYSISARLYANAGDVARAMAANNLILKLDPKHKDALANLSFINLQQGSETLVKEYKTFLNEIEDLSGEQADTPIPTSRKKKFDKGTDTTHKKNSQVHKTSFLNLAKENAKAADNILSRLRQLTLFSKLSHAELLQLKENTIVWDCGENITIMEEDKDQPSLFVILDGCVSIMDNDEEGQNIFLTTLNSGEFFGESFLFGQHDIHLLAITDSPSTILEISGSVMRSLAKKRTYILEILKKSCRRWIFYPTLARVPLFKYLTTEEQKDIAKYLSLVNVKKGSAIITEGEIDESLYLIKSGEVGVYTTLVEREELQVIRADQKQLYLATLKKGAFFGEAAFLTKEPREATISALTDVQLLKLPKQHLETLVKKYPEIEKVLEEYHQQRMLDNVKAIQAAFR